jgi:NADH-quinone oxidoreductase subunit G
MVVDTTCEEVAEARSGVMELLLVNHPLDCPICDQGGECELQDLAMGYGRDVSRYNDGKRVVKDKDIGPLVSTDMTRCIHCTRCVRFGEEIQGMPQLGTTDRGENMKIGTYIEQSVDHELSANIIDLCPVGALNNKPYRYSARAWEMTQRAAISPHDCVGTNLYAHVLRGTVKRIVPRENDAINETWIADRDRFSYEAIYSGDRLLSPRIKESGDWRDIDWEDALGIAAERLNAAQGAKTGIIASPSATLEEGHLLARLAEHLGTSNLDHRVERRDFSDQDNDPVFPWLGCDIADIENQDAILVIGSNLRQEAPILAHRVRKAALAGANVSIVSAERHEYFFDVENYLSGAGLVELLSSSAMQDVAAALKKTDEALILLGNIAGRHESYAAVRALAADLATTTDAKLGMLSPGANSAGLSLAGVLPHRGAGGEVRESAGLHAGNMLEESLDAVLLLNVEPDADLLAVADAVDKLGQQAFVVALTPFVSEALLEAADLLLPVGTFAETSGTFINAAGTWQSFHGFANPVGEARPAWKVLRVLGNLVEAPDFDYVTSEDVLAEARRRVGGVRADNRIANKGAVAAGNGADNPAREIDTPIYSVDGLVRRARALQLTPAAKRAAGEGAA